MVHTTVIVYSERAQAYLYQYGDNLRRMVGEELPRKIAKYAFDQMKINAPVRTGRLRDSIQMVKTPKGYRVGPVGVPYGGIVEVGARPHIISPRTGRYLSWIDTVTGMRVFARQVQHPGFPPRRFVARTAQQTRAHAKTLISQALQNLKMRSR